MSIKRIRFPFTILFIGVLMLASLNARSQNPLIQVTSVEPGNVCAGAMVTISFDVKNGNANNDSENYTNSSIYTAYLSNNSGGAPFSVLETFQTTNTAYKVKNNETTTITRTFNIPIGSATGLTYKIAIGSSAPSFIGSAGAGGREFSIEGVLTPGTIGIDQLICLNSAPSTLTNITLPTGGTGTFSYQWQSSIDNVTFSDISGAIYANYSPGSLSTSTYFRRLVSSGSCSPAKNSNVISILVGSVWTGAVNSDYLNSGNWKCAQIPDLSKDVIIPSGVSRYPTIESIGYANNLSIQTGASLTISGGNCKVAGSISNSGILNSVNGSIELGGSSARTIPAGLFSGNRIKDLIINNSAGTTLSGSLNLTGILKVSAGNFNSDGFLTLVSDASKTAVIDGTGTGTVSGNVTIQAYLPSGYGYKYLSSPFQAATVNELAAEVNLTDPFPTVYRYQEDKETAGWVNYVSPAGLLNPMQGYAFNLGASAAPKTIEMSGVVNNGPLSINLSNNNKLYTQGFNLVGNPYPSPVDWNTAGGWEKTNIDNALYYFKASSTDVYDGIYGSYVNGVSSDSLISNNIIPAMQGFFVHVSDATFPVSATLGINNTARTTLFPSAKILKNKGEKFSSTSSGFYNSDWPGSKVMLRMQAAYEQGALISDQAVIYFDDEASPKFDKAYDALKLMNTDTSVPNLYTISSDAQNLSINALPNSADSVRSIPLGLKVEKSGFINLSVSGLNDLPHGLKVYLMDAQSNILHNLGQNPAYRVNLNAGKHDERFSILFSLKDLAIQNSKDLFSAYYANGKVVYQLKGNPESSKASIRVSNVNGQVMHRSDFRGSESRELQIPLSPGIYVITCISQMRIESKKILVH